MKRVQFQIQAPLSSAPYSAKPLTSNFHELVQKFSVSFPWFPWRDFFHFDNPITDFGLSANIFFTHNEIPTAIQIHKTDKYLHFPYNDSKNKKLTRISQFKDFCFQQHGFNTIHFFHNESNLNVNTLFEHLILPIAFTRYFQLFQKHYDAFKDKKRELTEKLAAYKENLTQFKNEFSASSEYLERLKIDLQTTKKTAEQSDLKDVLTSCIGLEENFSQWEKFKNKQKEKKFKKYSENYTQQTKEIKCTLRDLESRFEEAFTKFKKIQEENDCSQFNKIKVLLQNAPDCISLLDLNNLIVSIKNNINQLALQVPSLKSIEYTLADIKYDLNENIKLLEGYHGYFEEKIKKFRAEFFFENPIIYSTSLKNDSQNRLRENNAFKESQDLIFIQFEKLFKNLSIK